ncbi:MAG: helix-turn-helix domain-containing protein [Thermacetogeniaceae bacterium]
MKALVEIIREERREAAQLLFLSFSNILDEVDVSRQALLFLDEMTRAAIFGGAPLENVMTVNEYYQKYLQLPLYRLSKERTTQLLEEALKSFFDLLDSDNSPAKNYSDVIEKVILILRSHYTKNIKLVEVARAVNFSTFHLCRIFKEETGISIGQFLSILRLSEAKKLLTYTDRTISSISSQLGYKDPSYFSRSFKKSTGILPSEYRQLSREKSMSLSYTQVLGEPPGKRLPLQKMLKNSLPSGIYKFIFCQR